jgi:hypothetical protein
VVNRRKPHVQTPVVSRYPAPAPIHNFLLLFLPPCGPHLIPFGHRVHWAKPTCLSTPRRPSKSKTFCACCSPAPTQIKPQPTPVILLKKNCTCNTRPRVNPHHVVNHSSHQGTTVHRSLDAPVLTIQHWNCFATQHSLLIVILTRCRVSANKAHANFLRDAHLNLALSLASYWHRITA